jgi:hypothetical protein
LIFRQRVESRVLVPALACYVFHIDAARSVNDRIAFRRFFPDPVKHGFHHSITTYSVELVEIGGAALGAGV